MVKIGDFVKMKGKKFLYRIINEIKWNNNKSCEQKIYVVAMHTGDKWVVSDGVYTDDSFELLGKLAEVLYREE